MQGYPNMRTVDEWDNDKKQLFPQSRVSVNHNKAVSPFNLMDGRS